MYFIFIFRDFYGRSFHIRASWCVRGGGCSWVHAWGAPNAMLAGNEMVPIWGSQSNRWHRELLTPANLTCSLFKMTIVGAVARKAAILQYCSWIPWVWVCIEREAYILSPYFHIRANWWQSRGGGRLHCTHGTPNGTQAGNEKNLPLSCSCVSSSLSRDC